MAGNTQRFSSRVEDYLKYRPGYPPEILDYLQNHAGLIPTDVVADIGSGTGKLSQLFLERGHTVYGVEPNHEMRQAAEALLGENVHFHSMNGSAEATLLAESSVDLVAAGQAFHWFDPQKAKQEFQRILRANGLVVLVWNSRTRSQALSPFMQAYEALLLKYASEYAQVKEANSDEPVIEDFFAPYQVYKHSFPNYQEFNFEELKGRFLSSSYSPLPGSPNHKPALQALAALFDQFQSSGLVRFEYTTWLYWGRWG